MDFPRPPDQIKLALFQFDQIPAVHREHGGSGSRRRRNGVPSHAGSKKGGVEQQAASKLISAFYKIRNLRAVQFTDSRIFSFALDFILPEWFANWVSCRKFLIGIRPHGLLWRIDLLVKSRVYPNLCSKKLP
jgi:hypothetical protein